MSSETAVRDSGEADGSGRAAGRSISVCHVVGSLGHGGRESLLEDLIRYSPPELAYTVCGFRVRADGGR